MKGLTFPVGNYLSDKRYLATTRLESLSGPLPPPYVLPRLLKNEELDPLCLVPKRGSLQAIIDCPRVGTIRPSLGLAPSSGLLLIAADFP